MSLSRWDPRYTVAEQRVRFPHKAGEHNLVPHLRPGHGELGHLNTIRIGRQNDLQFLDLTFHRTFGGEADWRSVYPSDGSGVLPLRWEGGSLVLGAYDDEDLGLQVRAHGTFKIKVFFADCNVIAAKPRPVPFAGIQVIPPSDGGDIRQDYLVIQGSEAQQLEGFLSGIAGTFHQYFHHLLPNGRTPADRTLEVDIVPAKEQSLYPRNIGEVRIWLQHRDEAGELRKREVRARETDSMWMVKHRARKYAGTAKAVQLLFFRRTEDTGVLEELEDCPTVGSYGIKSGDSVEVFTIKKPPSEPILRKPYEPVKTLRPVEGNILDAEAITWDDGYSYTLKIELQNLGVCPIHRLQPAASVESDEGEPEDDSIPKEADHTLLAKDYPSSDDANKQVDSGIFGPASEGQAIDEPIEEPASAPPSNQITERHPWDSGPVEEWLPDANTATIEPQPPESEPDLIDLGSEGSDHGCCYLK